MGKIMTLAETAVRINRSEATLRYWLTRDAAAGVHKEAPRSFKQGRRRMFTEESVEAWLEAQMKEASA